MSAEPGTVRDLGYRSTTPRNTEASEPVYMVLCPTSTQLGAALVCNLNPARYHILILYPG